MNVHTYKLMFHRAEDNACDHIVISAFNVLHAFDVVRKCYPAEYAEQVISTCFNCVLVPKVGK